MARASLTGTRIRERRTALGMKQADLARQVGISPAYINLIEHNRRRVSEALLETVAQVLGVDTVALAEGAEGALFDGLREAAARAQQDRPGVYFADRSLAAWPKAGASKADRSDIERPEIDRIEEFVGRFPGWANLLGMEQARVTRLERVLEQFSERMAQDPFLLDSLHEVLSAVTSLRSTSAILADEPQIEPEWRDRFLRTIQEESSRLAGTAEALVGYLDSQQEAETGLSSPQEQVEAWLETHHWHMPEPPEQDRNSNSVTGAKSANDDHQGAAVKAIADVPELASGAARTMALAHVTRARADAQALPLEPFVAALQSFGPDPGLLAQRFDVEPAQVFRRLATLPPDIQGVPPIGLVVCDGAGAMTFRRPVPGFSLPRFGAGCPLWPLYEALARPMQPIRMVIDIAGRLPQRFLTYTWCAPHRPGSFSAPRGGAMPMLSESMMLILPPPTDEASGARPVGTSCRVCPRGDCPARREPSILFER
ncbi:hypothetical protein BFP70_10805 [Thioclava sp. SK-1]|uniref:short-chain fatty acyl-CoA regulator family protein n=1 Tax=Thioclava sp. SK-1 TaxID=1889770 RepID=UPI0008255FAD|nr:short-chain fatty acyl-CoA regulator family protein [Thioclava sp. SK-1]OCX64522.1 hypothetical protein BFP70_10805 [Thioclava sp. SK-1]